MVFVTQNSTYELDLDANRIRRLEGLDQPTPRQGDDGIWKFYESITPVVVGLGVMVIWRIVDNIAQTTVTSPVQRHWTVQHI